MLHALIGWPEELWWPALSLSTFPLDIWSPTQSEAHHLARLRGQQVPGICLFLPVRAEVTGICSHAWFYTAFWNLNSSSYACIANSLVHCAIFDHLALKTVRKKQTNIMKLCCGFVYITNDSFHLLFFNQLIYPMNAIFKILYAPNDPNIYYRYIKISKNKDII